MVKKLLDYTQTGNVTLQKNIYFVVETMFAATRLSADFVSDFLSYLLENVPVSTDIKSMKGDGELMIVGYCLAVAQVAVHYKKLCGEAIVDHLPALVSILSEYLISGSQRIKSGAFTAIKNLLHYTLEAGYFKEKKDQKDDVLDGLDFNLLAIRDSSTNIHPIRKISMMLEYCLNSRFDQCYTEVLRLIATFIEIGGDKTVNFGGVELLTKVGNLAIKKPSYKAWVDCQGKFLEKYKSELFFSTLPMKLLDYDLNSESYSFDSRSYLIPVVQKHVLKESPHFFIDNFLPLIELLTRQKKDIKKEKQFLKVKKYETLIFQIWEILPNYFTDYSTYAFQDSTYLNKILKKLDKVIDSNLYTARSVALKDLCAIIDYLKEAPKENLLIKKARVFLMKKSIDYITKLSQLLINAPSPDAQEQTPADLRENEYPVVLQTISKFGWLAKKIKLNELFFTELTQIVEEFTQFELDSKGDDMEIDQKDKKMINQDREKTKRQILHKIDIIICLMERIKLSKRHCELIVQFADSIAKSKITQKKAFKILSIILTNYEVSTYQELQEMFSKLTGYAFNPTQQKQKLMMLKIFLGKIKKPKKETEEMEADYDDLKNNPVEDSDEEDEETEMKKVDITDDDRLEITNTVLPEIIVGFSSLQAKSKKLSESLLLDLVKLYRNHFNELLKKLLAGFAGNTVDTRSATLEILTSVLKKYPSEFSQSNLQKISLIIVLFLKENSTHLQKCVLRCLKKILVLLSKELVSEVAPKVLEAVLTFEGANKLNVFVKYILRRTLKKLGKEVVRKLVPEAHVALVDYVEKQMKREAKQLKKSK